MPDRPSELDEVLAFVAHALARHARERQRNGQHVPPSALALAGWCLEAAQNGTGAQKVSSAGLLSHGGRMEPPLLLTIPETAALLAVSARTVRNMLADGRLEPVKIGGATRIRRGDVEALASHASTSTRFRDQIEAKDGPGGNAA